MVTLIEVAPYPLAGEPGYILEVFNAVGESPLAVSAIESLRAAENLTERLLA